MSAEAGLKAPRTGVEKPGKGARVALAAKAGAALAPTREARAKLRTLRGPAPRLSTIEKDAEVAAYLRELFRRGYTLAGMHAACIGHFGAERAPSASRIGTFRQRVRGR